MLQAATQAASVILREFPHRLAYGVAVHAGSGNNGGDAYIVAAQLARAGIAVRLHAVDSPRTADAQRAAALAAPRLVHGAPTGRELLVVDGILGTGHRGALRDGVSRACAQLRDARDRGATIVALDLPSGLDATTGDIADGSTPADLTISFGTFKRGTLVARSHCGRIVLVDIGLDVHAQRADDAWLLADAPTLAQLLPRTAWNAHKGTRGQLALVGGAHGMVGAIVLASRAALGAGVGLVRSWVHADGIAALQTNVPQAIARTWPAVSSAPHADGAQTSSAWGTALAIGPGLGRDDAAWSLLITALRENAGLPVLLDADALTLVSMRANGDAAELLRDVTGGASSVVCTPHPREFARLLGITARASSGDAKGNESTLPASLDERAVRLREFAQRAKATVLLKGTPTLIATPDAMPLRVVARGTALLATGGSGDVLTGLIGALLAQGIPAADAALLGATAHGIAAECAASAAQGIRGLTLDDLLRALPDAWRAISAPAPMPPHVIAELPAPDDRW